MSTPALEQAKRVVERGTSFGIAARSGLFPPREVANAFFACGYDDLHESSGGEEVLEWEPFALSASEYDALFVWRRASHPCTRIDALGVNDADFSRWFTTAIDHRGRG